MLETGLYLPKSIYNMDETAFELGSTQRRRRIAPRGTTSKAHATLPKKAHMTVIAAIGTMDAPIPPYILFAGHSLMDEWFLEMDKTPKMMAAVTDSGYSNSFITMQWLKTCFDPATKARARRGLRLLFLDGPRIHTSMAFIEECWARRIVLFVLPANLSAIFQPLNVGFFKNLKDAYNRQLIDYQLGGTNESVPKSFFYA